MDLISFSSDEMDGGCDGTQLTIIQEKSCSVLVTTLLDAPFEIPWGSEIWARVKAFNIIGESIFSVPGNDAVILSVPSAPTNLVDVPEITNGFQIGLQWFAPQLTGGVEIIDYRVYSDTGLENDEFVIVDSSCSTTAYTVQALTPGLTYTFKVSARNIYGYGEASSTISILAA